MTNDWKVAALEHARRDYPREACGLVIVEKGREVYFPCRNLADGADHFVLDPEDYARAEDRGEIVAVFHSHPNAPATPSEADRAACEASRLPWHIAGFPAVCWASIEPCGYEVPLIGREWQHGTMDCYGIIRDYYRQVRGIELLDFVRRNDWWTAGENMYLDNFERAGFTKIDVDSVQVHDVVLMQIFSPVPNHGAVYANDGIILHHLANRLSSRDVYGGYYRKHTTHVLRYTGNS
jgi:proteasome lid subunit RPN8/RPN11